MVKDNDGNTIVTLKRVFPKCDTEEMHQFQGHGAPLTHDGLIQENRELKTEPESIESTTEIGEEVKFSRLRGLTTTPEPVKKFRSSGKT